MAVSSTAAQMGITASPVSVATVSLASILAENAGITHVSYSIPQIFMRYAGLAVRGTARRGVVDAPG